MRRETICNVFMSNVEDNSGAMHLSNAVCSFSTLFNRFADQLCLSNAPLDIAYKHDKLTAFKKSVQHHNVQNSPKSCRTPGTIANAPSKILSRRSGNHTGSGHIVIQDLSFLIPSQKHPALLSKMCAEIFDAILDALLDARRDGAANGMHRE